MIYLDNNASTSLDPRVISAMEKELREEVGNPSSTHAFGQKARSRLLFARRKIATYFNVKPHEVIFTSSGTEALNMVLAGAVTSGHIITSDVEHACVNTTLEALETKGVTVTRLPAGSWGAVKPDAVRKAIRPDTKLITLMATNNETGVKTDIHAVAEVAEELNIPFVVDGVALMGKERVTLPSGVSAFCFSGHKIHGPKGVGVAIIRTRLKLKPCILGGPQEYGRRGGTENLVGIVGVAEAVNLLNCELPNSKLRDLLEHALTTRLEDVTVNGEGPRVVNTTNLTFKGVDGESLLAHLDLEGIAASHGSACSAGALEPSRVLLNMGLAPELAASSLRFSLSRFTTQEEIELCISKVIALVQKLRRISTFHSCR